MPQVIFESTVMVGGSGGGTEHPGYLWPKHRRELGPSLQLALAAVLIQEHVQSFVLDVSAKGKHKRVDSGSIVGLKRSPHTSYCFKRKRTNCGALPRNPHSGRLSTELLGLIQF